jgi:hypothetical protein
MNIIQIILAIATIILTSSVVTVVIEYFLNKVKLKSERENSVEREIFFNLQKQAEKVFTGLDKIRWNFERINKFAETGNLAEFDTTIKNDQNELIEQLSPAQIYFSFEAITKYDKAVKIYREYSIFIRKIRSDGKITNEQNYKVSELVRNFNNAVQECKSLILTEIEKQKVFAKK